MSFIGSKAEMHLTTSPTHEPIDFRAPSHAWLQLAAPLSPRLCRGLRAHDLVLESGGHPTHPAAHRYAS